MHDDRQDQSQGVDREMAFAAGDFFAGIVAPNAADFRGFHALAVEDRGTGSRLSSRGTTDSLAERS